MEIKIHKLSLCTKIDMEKCISETDAKNKGHITPRNKRVPTGYLRLTKVSSKNTVVRQDGDLLFFGVDVAEIDQTGVIVHLFFLGRKTGDCYTDTDH